MSLEDCRYDPSWRKRKRRQTAQLWGVAMAVSLVTAAIILAVARVWPA